MAVLTAEYIEQIEYQGYSGLFNNLATIVQPHGDVRAVEESDSFLTGGVYTYAGNVSVPGQRALTAVFMDGWFADYYNRIVISPSKIDLKTLAAEITEDVYIWNAYLNSSKTLSSVTTKDVEGLTLSGLTPPVIFGPNQERKYSITAGLSGPGIIDAQYGFVFDSETPLLSIIGQRIVVWAFAPSNKMTETLEWLTDILSGFDAEQRIALRQAPRQSLKYDYILDELEFSIAKAIAEKWGSNLFGIPVWSELTRYGAITEGDFVLNMDTTMAEYFVDGFVFIKDKDNNQTLQATGLTDSQIQFQYPLKAFTNALVMPLKKGNVKQGFNFQRSANIHTQANCEFLIINENFTIDSVDGGLNYPSYLGDDVITDRQFAVSDLSESILQSVDIFDNGSGQIILENQFKYPRNKKNITFLAQTKKDRWNIKAWLYTRRGRQKRFWIISWNKDIFPIADIVMSEKVIRCKYMFYSLYRTETHTALIKTDGTILFNKILGASELDGNEILALENSFPSDILLSDIDRICFMTKVRLDADKVTINYSPAPLISKINIPVAEVQN